jgi:PAS domain S-box-containing protein
MSLVQTLGEKVLRAAHGRGLAVVWLVVALVDVVTTLIVGINTPGEVVYAVRSFVLVLLLAVGLKIVDSQFVYLSLASELLELTDDAMLVWRVNSAASTNAIEFWSEGAEKLYGFSAREAVGQNAHELLKTEFPISLDEIMRLTLDRGWAGTLIQTCKNGKKVSVSSQWVRRRFGAGNPRRSISILEVNSDVTDIQRRAALESAVAVRDDFLVLAGHELRTPVTVLNGYAQLLARTLSSPDHDDNMLRRSVEMVLASARKVTQLVSQLVDVSRVNTGKLRLDRGVIDVMPVFRSVVETASQSSAEHNISLRGPEVLAASVDSQRLQQVIQDLVNNAIKYSPDGGEITVEVDQVRDHLTFKVRDHGIGISPEHADHIFERYYRLQETGPQELTKEAFSGLGVGLFVSRVIVELHGGWITARPATDGQGGTEVLVVLPLNEPDEAQAAATILTSGAAA